MATSITTSQSPNNMKDKRIKKKSSTGSRGGTDISIGLNKEDNANEDGLKENSAGQNSQKKHSFFEKKKGMVEKQTSKKKVLLSNKMNIVGSNLWNSNGGGPIPGIPLSSVNYSTNPVNLENSPAAVMNMKKINKYSGPIALELVSDKDPR